MNSLLSSLPADGWPRLLCDALWQSTLIAAVGGLTARFLVRQAAARSWVLLLTLTGCLMVPLASLAMRVAGVGLLTAQADDRSNSIDRETGLASLPQAQGLRAPSSRWSLGLPVESDSVERTVHSATYGVGSDFPEPAMPSPNDSPENHSRPLSVASNLALPLEDVRDDGASNWQFGLRLLAVAWLSATALLLVRLFLSIVATLRLLRCAKLVEDPAILAAVAEASRRVGLLKTPIVLHSDKVTTPMVWAFGQPRLLVPTASDIARPCRSAPDTAGLYQSGTYELAQPRRQSSDRHGRAMCEEEVSRAAIDWTAVFAHELAHVIRGDGRARLWVELIRIALPLQPLVWLLRRKFHTACEEACDDWAIATGADPVELAATFSTWLNRPQPTAALAAIGMSTTKARMLRLLSMQGRPQARLSKSWRWAGISTAMILIAGIATAQTSKTPEKSVEPTAPPSSPDSAVPLPPLKGLGDKTVDEIIREILESDPKFGRLQNELESLQEQIDHQQGNSRRGAQDPMVVALRNKREAILSEIDAEVAKAWRKVLADRLIANRSKDLKAAQDTDTSSVPEYVVEMYLARDPHIEFYARHIAALKQSIDAIKAYGPTSPKETAETETDNYKERIKSVQELLDKRRAELRPVVIQRFQQEMLREPNRRGADATRGRQSRITLPPYVIEPPDILLLDPLQLLPKKPLRIAPLDKVKIVVDGAIADQPISGTFKVDSSGEVVLGPLYGVVKISGLSRREAEAAVKEKLKEILANPEVALIIDESRFEKGIKGEHLVGPDGTINLGAYGNVKVDGMTVTQARKAIEELLNKEFVEAKVSVDVYAYNSKTYYVIINGEGEGDQIQRFPITGNETLLDAVSGLKGISLQLSKRNVWIDRTGNREEDRIIPIKWSLGRGPEPNPQILPGDRIFLSGVLPNFKNPGPLQRWPEAAPPSPAEAPKSSSSPAPPDSQKSAPPKASKQSQRADEESSYQSATTRENWSSELHRRLELQKRDALRFKALDAEPSLAGRPELPDWQRAPPTFVKPRESSQK